MKRQSIENKTGFDQNLAITEAASFYKWEVFRINNSFFPPGATQPIVGVYFTAVYRTLAPLAYEITWSHTATRHSR